MAGISLESRLESLFHRRSMRFLLLTCSPRNRQPRIRTASGTLRRIVEWISPMRKLMLEFSRSAIFHVILLIALCGVLYFPFLGSVPFFDKGEPREALAVQDIVQRGQWLVPLNRGEV